MQGCGTFVSFISSKSEENYANTVRKLCKGYLGLSATAIFEIPDARLMRAARGVAQSPLDACYASRYKLAQMKPVLQ